MNDITITTDEIGAIFPKVAAAISEAIGREMEQVKLESSLIDDLGAESIDSSYRLFALEAVRSEIPRGKILEDARGPSARSRIRKRGVVSEVGLAQSESTFLNEVPPGRFKHPCKSRTFPVCSRPKPSANLSSFSSALPRAPHGSSSCLNHSPKSHFRGPLSRSSTGSRPSNRVQLRWRYTINA